MGEGGKAMFFLTSTMDILAYTWLPFPHIFDCRLFVASGEVFAMCASANGYKVVQIGYDGKFQFQDEWNLRLTGQYWQDRNPLILPCKDKFLRNLWEENISEFSEYLWGT